ncbi:hypothetical protein ACIBL8_46865 [Streptomyces sp. NPDC050523]|uniref:hypothetical protein n=1 Tax=Streptomyces sp. NPDC050523 TaxID=3365622 RepID=UPI0037988552
MSDLKKQATSMHKVAPGLRGVGHHTAKPLQEFKAQSHSLGALGRLGSLLGATNEIGEDMSTLARLTKSLDEEWEAEATLIGEVSDAFGLVDVLIVAAARAEKG